MTAKGVRVDVILVDIGLLSSVIKSAIRSRSFLKRTRKNIENIINSKKAMMRKNGKAPIRNWDTRKLDVTAGSNRSRTMKRTMMKKNGSVETVIKREYMGWGDWEKEKQKVRRKRRVHIVMNGVRWNLVCAGEVSKELKGGAFGGGASVAVSCIMVSSQMFLQREREWER